MTALHNDAKQKIHKIFQIFKIRCASGSIQGSEAITLEFIYCFGQLIAELSHFDSASSIRDLAIELFEEQFSALSDNNSTLLPPPTLNIIKELTKLISDADPNITHHTLLNQITQWINEFHANNESATQSIVDFTLEKIRGLQAKNILTYGFSSIVERVLLKLAKNPPQNLHVKVVDGSDKHTSGKSLLKALVDRQIYCTYGFLNCLANELIHTDLVLLGASAVLSDGSLVVRRGSSSVVYLARAFNVPVLVTAKSFQFVDRVTVIDLNMPSLDTEIFEVISPEMVAGIVTEIRILPATSAPGVISNRMSETK